MTALQPPSFMQNSPTESAAEARLFLNGMVIAAGAVRSGDLKVTQTTTPSMNVQIAGGGCFIAGTSAGTQGTYHCYNDASVTLSVAAADPSNNRVDLVVAEVLDSFYGSSQDLWRLRVVTGTPSGSPSAPSITGNVGFIALASILVNSGSSSVNNAQITDLRPFARAIGTPLIGTALGNTTDASGFSTISHNAGFTPGDVRAFVASPLSGFTNLPTIILTDTYTSTTFRARVFSTTGGVMVTGGTGNPSSIDVRFHVYR